ncbi:oxidoreductase, partial [Dietzia sp. E1]|nr:oxidoreductase [Dietzia sp. E1]
MDSTEQRPRAVARAASGLLATGLAVAVGHAVAGVVAPGSSPFLAVADSVVDRAPAAVRKVTIDALGTADKPALMIGLAAILLVTGVVVGLVERPRRPAGSAVLVVFGLVGMVAALARPSAGPLWAVPTLLGV